MCGIAGWLGDAPAHRSGYEVLESAGRLLHHRGPDDGGFSRGARYGLAFRRLAIIDVSPTGRQPMSSSDGRYVLVMNGEIYNHVELRQELQSRGVRFRGSSDTEVLLHLLARDGRDALERCNGMFGFAFLDLERQRFLLGRDRLGVKPLYYRVCSPTALRFASELKALLAWPDEPRSVDPTALAAYLALGHVPGDLCIWEGYRKLAPAHLLDGDLHRPGEAVATKYWSLEVGGDEPADLDELEQLLQDAVRLRLRSDVPVGVFLSGGLDSGLVACLAARAAGQEGREPPLAATVAFTPGRFDESRLARQTADAAGLRHIVIPQDGAALSDLDRLAWYFDEPFGDASALPSMALAEAASRHAVVWLSGDGGDEAFAGYRRYLEAGRYRGLAGLPAPLKTFARAISSVLPETSALRYRVVKATAPGDGYAAAFDSSPDDPLVWAVAGDRARERLVEVRDAWWQGWAGIGGSSLTARQQALDYASYLPDDILVKVDRASMAHGIEVRSPFLDVRVVEWAARRRRNDLMRAGLGKLPVRALGQRLLPADVLAAEKHGFEAPVAQWLRSADGQRLARARLLGSEAEALGWWRVPAARRLLDAQLSARGRHLEPLIWRLLVLEAWHRHYATEAFLDGPTANGVPEHREHRRGA
jgi:asparagine synthase (glutamine-hydrolysing)